jgi:hypothetical protein
MIRKHSVKASMKKTTLVVLFFVITTFISFAGATEIGATATYYLDGKKLKSKPEYIIEGQRLMMIISSKNKNSKYAKGYIYGDLNRGAQLSETGNLNSNVLTLEQTAGKKEVKSGYVVFVAWFKNNSFSKKNSSETPVDSFVEVVSVLSKKKAEKESNMTDDEKDARALKGLGIKEYSGSGSKGFSR